MFIFTKAPLEAWLNTWNVDCPLKIFVLLRKAGNPGLSPVDLSICRNTLLLIDLDKELSELIEKTCNAILSRKPKVAHVLKGYAKMFDVSDRVVSESLARMIRIRLEKELTSKALLVRDITLSRNDDNLIVSAGILNE